MQSPKRLPWKSMSMSHAVIDVNCVPIDRYSERWKMSSVIGCQQVSLGNILKLEGLKFRSACSAVAVCQLFSLTGVGNMLQLDLTYLICARCVSNTSWPRETTHLCMNHPALAFFQWSRPLQKKAVPVWTMMKTIAQVRE